MQTSEKSRGARDPRGHPRPVLARVWVRIVDGLAATGTVLIGLLMLIICSDIVFRNLLGSSLPLVSELGALVLVMIVYLQLAATIRADRLARTEIFLPPLRRRFPRLAAVIAALFDLVSAMMLALIAWSTLGIFAKDLASGEYIGVTGIATMPTWPFRALILLGICVATLECVVRAAASLRQTPPER